MTPIELYQKVLNQRLNELETDQIEAWTRQYPYFSLPYFVKARQTKEKQALFAASLYAANRYLLKRFMDGTIIIQEQNFREVIEEQMRKSTRPFSYGENDTFSIVDFDSLHQKGPEEPIPFRHLDGKSRHIDSFLNWEIKVRTLKYLPLVQQIQAALDVQTQAASSPQHLFEAPANQGSSAVKDDILDRFLDDPRSIRSEPGPFPPLPDETALASLEEDDEMVSETLAHIHLMQKNYGEAIRIYEKLSLLFPEKKAYFANQIRMIRSE